MEFCHNFFDERIEVIYKLVTAASSINKIGSEKQLRRHDVAQLDQFAVVAEINIKGVFRFGISELLFCGKIIRVWVHSQGQELHKFIIAADLAFHLLAPQSEF